MSRITRRTFAAMSAGVLLITTLSGCGSSQATVKDGAFDTKQPIPASQAFKQKSIWYKCDEPSSENGEVYGKDLYVVGLYVFDGTGKVTYYDYSEKLGALKDKSDEQIISDAKARNRKVAEDALDKVKNDYKDDRSLEYFIDHNSMVAEVEQKMADEYTWNLYSDSEKQAYLDEKAEGEKQAPLEKAKYDKIRNMVKSVSYADPEPATYELSIATDASGNQTAEESLQTTIPNYQLTPIEQINQDANIEYPEPDARVLKLIPINKFQVYNNWYGGFSTLITKVGQTNAGFILDSPNTEGIKVDE
ncbi:hypothetical protein BAAM0483_05015 [Bifidobacterium animalis subsp. animalis MCC 0483]|uniref:Uncharacterized protein n=1 Tax=Bifidobacterium animalis subsp. animalis MCC 0483 TaxID=1365955 RepID=A0AB34T8K8_9BIFI|nr:hypothetical protein [Bifidobacterium animalis]KOA49508.1 hypothetical protein BAAM0483_05015 [Bifidobacterium animalis subsp. animalis MCC 0483]